MRAKEYAQILQKKMSKEQEVLKELLTEIEAVVSYNHNLQESQ
jgi:hypothetical protein